MIIKELYKHNFLAVTRSPVFDKQKPERILIIAGTVFIIFNLTVLGFFLDSLINLIYPNRDSLIIFNSVLIYLFALDLFFRSLAQKLPKADFIPYLLFPVYKSGICRFLISKSFLSFLNFYLLFTCIPFFLKTIPQLYDMDSVIPYCTGFIMLIVSNQLLMNILNSAIQKRFLIIFLPLVLILILFTVRFYFHVHIDDTAMFIGTAWLEGNIYVFAAQFIIMISLYLLNTVSFKKLISGETDYGNIIKKSRKIAGSPGLFSGSVFTGEFIRLELFMIYRNKRTRQNLYYAAYFILYIFLFIIFNKTMWESDYVLLVLYLVLTGIFSLIHGQFFLSWDSSFFDFIQTQNISFFEYLKAKYYLLLMSNILLGIVLFPLILLLQTDLYLFVSIMIFNCGVTNLLVIYNSIYNSGKIDLSRRAYANWQGTGTNQFVLILVIVFIPMAIFYLAGKLFPALTVYMLLSLAGIIAAAFHNKWIRFTAERFRKRKYINLGNYRK